MAGHNPHLRFNAHRGSAPQHASALVMRFCIGLLLVSTSQTALAGTTSIVGYVLNPEGAPLPGTTISVTVSGPALQGAQKVHTDARGFYRVTQLPPGDDYSVLFEAAELANHTRAGISIHANQTVWLPEHRLSAETDDRCACIIAPIPMIPHGSSALEYTFTRGDLERIPNARLFP